MIPLPPYLQKISAALFYLVFPVLGLDLLMIIAQLLFDLSFGIFDVMIIIINFLYIVPVACIAVLRHLFVEVEVEDSNVP